MMPKNNRADKYRRNAQGYFSRPQKHDPLLKAEQEKAQADNRVKIARLKALRLAQEGAINVAKPDRNGN